MVPVIDDVVKLLHNKTLSIGGLSDFMDFAFNQSKTRKELEVVFAFSFIVLVQDGISYILIFLNIMDILSNFVDLKEQVPKHFVEFFWHFVLNKLRASANVFL